MYLRNELKLSYHYILSYICNTFLVRHLYGRWTYKWGGGLYPGGLISGILYSLANG